MPAAAANVFVCPPFRASSFEAAIAAPASLHLRPWLTRHAAYEAWTRDSGELGQ